MGRDRGNKLKESPFIILGQEMDGVQPKARKGSLCKEDSSLLVSIAKGMIVSKAFSSQLGGSMPKIGLKKLRTRLSPPISSCQQGLRRQSRPLLQEVLTSTQDVQPWDVAFKVGSQKARRFSSSLVTSKRQLGFQRRCSREGLRRQVAM